MSKGKFAIGALVGAVAGVVAGVLTAPKSGKETRADLKAKADEVRADASKKAEDAKVRGKKVVDDTKKSVDDYRGRAERAAKSAKAEFNKEDK